MCPPPLKVSWDAEIEMEIKRKKEAKRKVGGASGSSPSGNIVELPAARSRPVESASGQSASKEVSGAHQPAPQLEPPAPVKVSSAAQDLLGLGRFGL